MKKLKYYFKLIKFVVGVIGLIAIVLIWNQNKAIKKDLLNMPSSQIQENLSSYKEGSVGKKYLENKQKIEETKNFIESH